MPKALTVERAPDSAFAEILIRRDGEPDLLLEKGRLALQVKTIPVELSKGSADRRWKVYRLYMGQPTVNFSDWSPTPRFGRLVVAEEGHSSKRDETTLYSASICVDAVEVWEAMGRMDELKEPLAQLGLPVVQRI